MSRIYSKFLINAALLFFAVIAPKHSEGALTLSNTTEAVVNFLSEAHTAQALQEKILSSMRFDARKNIVSVINNNGAVFSLYVIDAQDDNDDYYDAINFENVLVDEALFFARNNLAFFIGQGKTDRDLYRYDDPLAQALYSYYSRPREINIKGIETRAGVVKTHNIKVVIALAWLSSASVNIFDKDIPLDGVLDEDYCRVLYTECASVLFRNGFYSEALPMFRNIHRLHWANVNAYIDAAECFAKTGEPEECSKLLKELIRSLEEKMNSDDLIRAGRLFRSVGEHDSALLSFKLARKHYRQGN